MRLRILTPVPGVLLVAAAIVALLAPAIAQTPTPSSSVRNVSNYPGNDLALRIAACQADLPSSGGICDAREINGNRDINRPIAVGSTSKPVVLLLGPGILTTSAPITIYRESRLEGMGRELTVIRAARSFPANTPLVRFENTTQMGMRIENIHLDCNDVDNSIGVELGGANEQAGLRHVLITRYRKYGIYGTKPAGNFAITDSELMASVGARGSRGIFLDDTGGRALISYLTIGTYAGAPQQAAAIELRNTVADIFSLHVENHAAGVYFGTRTAGAITSFLGMTDVGTAVHLATTDSVGLFGITTNGAKLAVKNDVTGTTIPDHYLPSYWYENRPDVGPQEITSSPSVPEHFRNSVEAQRFCTMSGKVCWSTGMGAPIGACVNGSLYTRTDAATGSTLFVCESGQWKGK